MQQPEMFGELETRDTNLILQLQLFFLFYTLEIKTMGVMYLHVVGDGHSDAVLVGDVVGAVVWGAGAGAGGAAACRV